MLFLLFDFAFCWTTADCGSPDVTRPGADVGWRRPSGQGHSSCRGFTPPRKARPPASPLRSERVAYVGSRSQDARAKQELRVQTEVITAKRAPVKAEVVTPKRGSRLRVKTEVFTPKRVLRVRRKLGVCPSGKRHPLHPLSPNRSCLRGFVQARACHLNLSDVFGDNSCCMHASQLCKFCCLQSTFTLPVFFCFAALHITMRRVTSNAGSPFFHGFSWIFYIFSAILSPSLEAHFPGSNEKSFPPSLPPLAGRGLETVPVGKPLLNCWAFQRLHWRQQPIWLGLRVGMLRTWIDTV